MNNITQVENATRTTLTDKNVDSAIYIKILQCGSDTKVKILDEKGSNCVFYGNYYTLKEGQQYILLNTIYQQKSKKVMLTFDKKVTFEWNPDFTDILPANSGIQIMRYGTYEPELLYDYDTPCNLQVVVTSTQGVRFRDAPSILGNVINDIMHVELHETVNILYLKNDFGYITRGAASGWICIRYCSILGCEGQCACMCCQQVNKKQFPRYNSENYLQIEQLCTSAVNLFKAETAFKLAQVNLDQVSKFDLSESKQVNNVQWKASDVQLLLKSLVLGNTLQTVNWAQTHLKFTNICPQYKTCTNQSLRQVVLRQINGFKTRQEEYFKVKGEKLSQMGNTWGERLLAVIGDENSGQEDVLACLYMLKQN
ncbi:Hypothetical_protein [Hexamita inflata]|uniref:Hypothetical_protein n=1 Tax=Hexamita inflata TaxID=28002 RepID=A0AA86R961_9EUKA|nr:Hypothetical protein HINF_LOCUS59487 [Hexamita inflata]